MHPNLIRENNNLSKIYMIAVFAFDGISLWGLIHQASRLAGDHWREEKRSIVDRRGPRVPGAGEGAGLPSLDSPGPLRSTETCLGMGPLGPNASPRDINNQTPALGKPTASPTPFRFSPFSPAVQPLRKASGLRS